MDGMGVKIWFDFDPVLPHQLNRQLRCVRRMDFRRRSDGKMLASRFGFSNLKITLARWIQFVQWIYESLYYIYMYICMYMYLFNDFHICIQGMNYPVYLFIICCRLTFKSSRLFRSIINAHRVFSSPPENQAPHLEQLEKSGITW